MMKFKAATLLSFSFKISKTSFLKIMSLALVLISISTDLQAIETEDSLSRPVTGVYGIEIGGRNVLATYLSPLHYTGRDLALFGEWSKAMPFNPERAVMNFRGGANFSDLLNPARNSRMIGLNACFSWGMAWRLKFHDTWQFTLGGATEMKGGAYYLIRNSNNPVQVMANIGLDLYASVSKTFKIGRLPVLVSDKAYLPVAGAFFNPEYGESFYEIYLGNNKGLVHPGWWGNNFCIDNLVSFTLDFGRTALMIGYRFNLYSQWANNLNTKIFLNAFSIGIIPGGIGLKKNYKKTNVNEVYSIY